MNSEKVQDVTLEELFLELDQIIEKMESGQLALDQAFALYEAGVAKVKQCSEKLDLIEKKMIVLNTAGDRDGY